MTNSPQQPPAGWYPDPAGSGGERFWDGVAWSQSTRDKAAPQPAPDAPHSAPPAGGAPSYGTPSGGQQYSQQPYAGQQQYGQAPQPYQDYGQGYAYGPQLPRPAGFWWRFLGYLIDGIIVGILTRIVAGMLGFQAALDRATEAWSRDLLIWAENPEASPFPMPGDDFMSAASAIAATSVVLWILYRIGMYAWKSATLGMMAVGLRLVKADDWDAKLGMGTIVLRAVASTIRFQITLLNVINGLMAAFTAKKQTLGDMIARTQVLKVR